MTVLIPGDTTLRIIDRPFRDEADFWRVRDLLIETYPITPVDFNWEIRRWDGRRFHNEDNEDLALNPRWSASHTMPSTGAESSNRYAPTRITGGAAWRRR